MAQLLGIHILQDSPIISCRGSYFLSPESGDKESSDKKNSCYLNPVFQTPEEPKDCSVFVTPIACIETDSKRSLSPSDSGIDITEDSLKGSKDSKSSNNTFVVIPAKDPSKKKLEAEEQESLLAVAVQVLIPFFIAGVGTCCAGLLLDHVEKWDVFVGVKELFVLVPTLLGLKGNLEMTLASRVSTQANLGQLETGREQWRMTWGNLALIQCQATTLALISSFLAIGINSVSSGFQIEKALLLCGSALFTASVASLGLGAITIIVVLLSKKFHINPDNVATPIAASLGDVSTLGILAAIASYLYKSYGSLLSSSVCVAVFVLLVPLWWVLSYKNDFVKSVLRSGWAPVVIAVFITSIGGYILEYSIKQFDSIAVFQPVINGLAGNLVAVQASRISTYFHAHSEPGSRPPDDSNFCPSPCSSFFGKSPHARTALILLGLVVPGHVFFFFVIKWVKNGGAAFSEYFLPIYVVAAVIQVALLLYIAQCLINILWRWKMDPDNWAIPLMTALGDLSGMIALLAAFWIRRSIGV